ncbi:hemerythrin domain-containing protein [Marinifilum sp.]|uniref:hemerythrin domain-containing protein n=1 Tax=Marinifilum sp. TaxID=2033137 RepID=UPI003BA8DAF1
MAEIILKDYQLLPIMSRFGIKLGFGNKTVEEVCTEKGVNVAFFLEILNSYHNSNYYPDNHLSDFNAAVMVDYLTNTHNYYLKSKVPHIELFIDKMEREAHEDNSRNIALLKQFFSEYKIDIKHHFKEEEKNVFPYILDLEKAISSSNCEQILINKIKQEPIEVYERNHESLEVKLADMKNLIIRFLPPLNCEDDCEHLLTELFELECDIEDHTRMEEKVLIPKVKMLEEKVLEYYGV